MRSRPSNGMEQRMHRLAKNNKTFTERLAEEAEKFKRAAEELPIGSRARELMLRRVRQAETAANMDSWLASANLKSPK